MSIKASLEITGAKETATSLRKAARQAPDETRIIVEEELGQVTNALQVYPPERPGQKYRRTGFYRRSISRPVVRLSGRDIVGEIEQRAPYSRFVRGDAAGQGQAWMHKGRWETTRAILERYLPRVLKRIGEQLTNLFNRGR